MFLLLLIVSLALALKPKEVITLDELSKMLDSIPLDIKAVADPTLDTLIKLVDMYVFDEMAKDPIPPFGGMDQGPGYARLTPVDLKARLNSIRGRIDSFDNDFSFHNELSHAYLDLKDPHTVYAKPQGYAAFRLALPLTLSPSLQKDGKMEYVLSELPPEYSFVTQAYRLLCHEQGISLDSFIGGTVAKINGIDAHVAVQQFADDLVYVSKNPHARYNRALSTDFYLRSLRVYCWPGTTGSPLDTETYTFEFSSLEGTLELPLLAFSTVEFEDAYAIAEKNRPSTETGAVETPTSPLRRFLAADVIPAPTLEDEDNMEFSAIHTFSDLSLYRLTRDNKLVAYLLNILTFAPEDPNAFVDAFEQCMQAMDDKQSEDAYLFVNLAENGGGYVTLGYRVLHVLAPTVEPLFGNYTVRKSRYAEYYASAGLFARQARYRLTDWMRYRNNAWYTGETQTFTFPTSQAVDYSGTYTFDLAYDEGEFVEALDHLMSVKPPSFLQKYGVSRLVFLTDGTCGSTCATLANRAREARAGLWIGIGGNVELRDNISMVVASFAGGSVMDTDYIFSKDFLEDNVEERLSIRRLPTSAIHRWAFEQLFSWNTSQKYSPVATPLEFVNNPVDLYVDLWPTPKTGMKSPTFYRDLSNAVYDTVTTKGCLDFQVQLDTEYCPPLGNKLFGHQCNPLTNTYSPTTCAFYSCMSGYILSLADLCEPVHEKWDQPQTAIERGIYAGLAVVLALLIGALTGYFVWRCIVFARAKRTASIKSAEIGETGETSLSTNNLLVDEDDDTETHKQE
ncbi:hypothetical protein GMRT_10587 [Giardia muris]|uniref:Tail specific protease domain-containing protein n=1 Tax=Giardia muris TaxID=5742 RepID=A0A4Z1SMB9_GIAMU|nr:hypothetical protein GMRT_10587 [Giardia muris]|eukprot:TNJ26834.1 hypothetical protein GMRT_10587 [Giardia muris]